MKIVHVVTAFLLVSVTSFGIGACGLLGGDIRIDLPDQTFPFSLDAGLLRQSLEDNLGISLSGQTEIPAGYDIKQTFSFELDPQKVDFSDNQDLKKYIDAGKVSGVTVKYVQYTISTNSLNFALPSLEMWLDGYDATGITASSEKVAVSGSIAAGWMGTDEVQFTTDGRQILSDFLMSLKFAFIGKTDVTVDTSVTRTIPSGQIDGQVTVGLYFTVSPL
jgi:hypothetical protein